MKSGSSGYPGGAAAKILAGLLVLLGLAAVPSAVRMEVDNRLERWVEPHGAAARDYADFRERFGSDEFVLVTYGGQDIFGEAALDLQLDVLDRLEMIDGLQGVSGIPVVFRDYFGAEDAEALRDEIMSTPFYKDFLVSRDGKSAALLIETKAANGTAGRRALVQAIHEAVEPLRDRGYAVHQAGPPLLNAALDETSQREAQRVFPVAVVLSCLLLWALFRSLRATAVAVACAGLSVLLTFGVMALFHRSLNMVSSALPPLLWVIALSNSIHIIRRYQRHRGKTENLVDALRRALTETAPPCTLASLTTAAGFLSLVSADMAPVRELGFLAAAGIALSLPVNLTVGPLLTAWFRVPGIPKRETGPGKGFGALTPVLHQWRRSIVAAGLLLGLGFAGSLAWLRVESDPLTFLPKDSTLVQDHTAIADQLGGFYTLEMVVRTPGAWTQPACWDALEELAGHLEGQPGVVRVLSPLDVLKKLNQWDHGFDPGHYVLPSSEETAQGLVAEMDEETRRELERLVTSDGSAVRLSALINVMDSTRFMAIVDTAERALAALPAPLTGYHTGIVLQLVESQLSLVDTQVRSLGLAFLTIFVCILIGLRSFRLTVVSILPNALPILAAFAAMALLNVALDAATVMVASVALGIAVDDTVHVLSEFRRASKRHPTTAEAVSAALNHAGPAMAITTVAASIGFFSLLRSAFIPIGWFGLLSGIAMLVALAADLLFTPALLLCVVAKTSGSPDEPQ